MPALDSLSKTWADRVASVFLYTREAHPGDAWPHHHSMEDKRARAGEAAQRWGLQRPMLVDDLEGTAHRAYGTLPNMAWVVDRRGRIAYRASWTDARTLKRAVEQVLWEEEQLAGGAKMMPFRCDWAPRRVRDRPAFVRGLLQAGPRAFDEFVAAGRAAGWPKAALQELLDARESIDDS